MDTLTQLYTLLAAHQWVPLVALIVGLLVRALKDDTKLPVSIPPEARKWLALALGAVCGVLNTMATGKPLGVSLVEGLSAGLLAMAGHDVVVEGVRGGKEFPLPGLTKKRSEPGSLNVALIFLVTSCLVFLLFATTGCSALFHWKDPTAQAVSCAITGALLPELEALAAMEGVPLAFVEDAYASACAVAAAKGLDQRSAHDAGMLSARAAAKAAHKLGAKFPTDGGVR